MDSSGFLTLIAVLLTAASLLSEGRKITYKNKFGTWHLITIFISLAIILWCLFYDFFSAHNLLLPYQFISGFGPSQVILLISIVLLCFIPYIAIYGETRTERLASLCKSLEDLLSSGKFGELLYVLTENKVFLSKKRIKSQNITKQTIRRLLSSHAFNEVLKDTSYDLFHSYVSLYPQDDFFNAMYCEFIREESIKPNSLFNWEVAYYRNEGAQIQPSEDTPYIWKIYNSSDYKYLLYQTLTGQFEELISKEQTEKELNKAPDSRDNYCRDKFLNKSPESLILFLVINSYHNDLRRNNIPDTPLSERRVPWLIAHHQLIPLIDKKKTLSPSNTEFESRIDYFLWESMCRLRETVSDCKDKNELEALLESFAYVTYKILKNINYSDCFKFTIVSECIGFQNCLPPENQPKFQNLCNRSHDSSPRDPEIPTQLVGKHEDPILEQQVIKFLQ